MRSITLIWCRKSLTARILFWPAKKLITLQATSQANKIPSDLITLSPMGFWKVCTRIWVRFCTQIQVLFPKYGNVPEFWTCPNWYCTEILYWWKQWYLYWCKLQTNVLRNSYIYVHTYFISISWHSTAPKSSAEPHESWRCHQSLDDFRFCQ